MCREVDLANGKVTNEACNVSTDKTPCIPYLAKDQELQLRLASLDRITELIPSKRRETPDP